MSKGCSLALLLESGHQYNDQVALLRAIRAGMRSRHALACPCTP
jgi:hypothetical protein